MESVARNDGMRRRRYHFFLFFLFATSISTNVRNSFVPVFFFISRYSHINQTSSWLPPIDNWNGSIQAGASGGTSLPYGWEAATDREGKAYFIKWVIRKLGNWIDKSRISDGRHSHTDRNYKFDYLIQLSIVCGRVRSFLLDAQSRCCYVFIFIFIWQSLEQNDDLRGSPQGLGRRASTAARSGTFSSSRTRFRFCSR